MCILGIYSVLEGYIRHYKCTCKKAVEDTKQELTYVLLCHCHCEARSFLQGKGVLSVISSPPLNFTSCPSFQSCSAFWTLPPNAWLCYYQWGHDSTSCRYMSIAFISMITLHVVRLYVFLFKYLRIWALVSGPL